MGVKSFDQQVGLYGTKSVVKVGRKINRIRSFFFQIGSKPNNADLASHSCNMQVLIASRRPEAANILHEAR